MTYIEFVNELKIRNTGSQVHHIIPKSVQRKANGCTYSEDVVKCEASEHLWLHILYDRENGTKTRNILWQFFRSRSSKEVDWKTCALEDLEEFNKYWDQRNQTISKVTKNKSKEWKDNIRKGTQSGKQSLPKSDEWKEAISEARKKQGATPKYYWVVRNIETGETTKTYSLRGSLKEEIGESGCIILGKSGVYKQWLVLEKVKVFK